MKKFLLSVFAVCLFMTMVLVTQAMAEAKPTVLYIYGQSCGACTRFEPTFDLARSKYSQKFNFQKEEYESSAKAKQLHVSETPSVYILDGNKVQKIDWSCLSNPGCLDKTLQSYQ